MRAVALSRLCFGTAAPETLGALVDLAEGYADAGLWPQAGAHAARAAASRGRDGFRELSTGETKDTRHRRIS